MKRIYLVKKDPLMPPAEDNWIYMNQHEFINFMNTPAGKRRKENFGQLDAIDEGDVIYIVECENKLAKQLRKDKNNSDYLRAFEKNITFLSLDAPENVEDDDRGYIDLLFLSEEDIVHDVLRKMDLDTLRHAISTLDESEKDLIQNLFFSPTPLSEAEYGKLINKSQQIIHHRKKRIFEKIKKFF